MDSRVVAISRASERILNSAGAWTRVAGPRVEAYERMRIWHESTSPANALVFDAAEVGEPNLGYIIENRLLQAALLDEFTAAGGASGVCRLSAVARRRRCRDRGNERGHIVGQAGDRRRWRQVSSA